MDVDLKALIEDRPALLEAVGKAMYERSVPFPAWDTEQEHLKEAYRGQANAVLLALGELGLAVEVEKKRGRKSKKEEEVPTPPTDLGESEDANPPETVVEEKSW